MQKNCSVLLQNKTLWSFEDPPTNACHYFIFDLLSGSVDASNILALISIGVPPVHFRNYRMLVANFHRTNYSIFKPIKNTMLLCKTVLEYFDFIVRRTDFRVDF